MKQSLALILTICVLLSMTTSGLAQTNPTVASGEGSTREEALNSAIRNAVEQAMGVSVDASTLVKNYKTISDRIYTHANGYVKEYTIVQEEQAPEGIIRITVSAVVERQKLKSAVQTLVGDDSIEFDGSVALANHGIDKSNRESLENAYVKLVDELYTDGLRIKFQIKTDRFDFGREKRFRITFSDCVFIPTDTWYQKFWALRQQAKTQPYFREVIRDLARNYRGHELVADFFTEEGKYLGTQSASRMFVSESPPFAGLYYLTYGVSLEDEPEVPSEIKPTHNHIPTCIVDGALLQQIRHIRLRFKKSV